MPSTDSTLIGNAELAQRLLVALELAAARALVVGVPRLDALGELLEREGAAGVEQRGREVDQALEPISHRARRSTEAAAERAGGGSGLEQRRVFVCGAPHRLHVEVVLGEQLQSVGRVDFHELVPARDSGGVEVGPEPRRLLGVVELRHRDQHPLAGGDAKGGRGVM